MPRFRKAGDVQEIHAWASTRGRRAQIILLSFENDVICSFPVKIPKNLNSHPHVVSGTQVHVAALVTNGIPHTVKNKRLLRNLYCQVTVFNRSSRLVAHSVVQQVVT